MTKLRFRHAKSKVAQPCVGTRILAPWATSTCPAVPRPHPRPGLSSGSPAPPGFHPSQEDRASTGVDFLQKQGSLSLNPRHSPTLPVTGPVPAKDGDFLSPPPQWHNFHFVSDRWKQIQVLPASPLTYRSQPWRLALSCVFPGII